MPPYEARIGRGIHPLERRSRPADREDVRARLRSERGFGLIELLIAMVMLNVGILAIAASFNAGIVSLNRSSKISTALTLADSQMELYRALTWSAIALDPATIPSTTPYTTDTAYSSTQVTASCSWVSSGRGTRPSASNST